MLWCVVATLHCVVIGYHHLLPYKAKPVQLHLSVLPGNPVRIVYDCISSIIFHNWVT